MRKRVPAGLCRHTMKLRTINWAFDRVKRLGSAGLEESLRAVTEVYAEHLKRTPNMYDREKAHRNLRHKRWNLRKLARYRDAQLKT